MKQAHDSMATPVTVEERETRQTIEIPLDLSVRPEIATVSGVVQPEVERPLNWKNVLWREWRHTDDMEYAEKLFEVLGKGPVGKWGWAAITAFGGLFGSMAGVAIATFGAVWMHAPMPTSPSLWAISLLGALTGSGVTARLRSFLGRRLTWKRLLEMLAPKVSKADLFGAFAIALFLFMPFAVAVGMLVSHLAGLLIGLGGVLFWGMATGFLIPMVAVLFLGGLFLSASGYFTYLGVVTGGWLFCALGAIAPRSEYINEFRHFFCWWGFRPTPAAVERALRKALADQGKDWEGFRDAVVALDRVRKRGPDVGKAIDALQQASPLERWVGVHALCELGGEAVTPLTEIHHNFTFHFRETVRWILAHISRKTTARFEHRARRILCSRCLTRFAAIAYQLSPSKERGFLGSYYGCRDCCQSRDYIEAPDTLVAVLDSNMSEETALRGGSLWINALKRATAFDFDRVEILDATDEQVEKFVVRLGNDVDEVRRGQYPKTPCAVSARCNLSENSLRILKSALGEVRVVTGTDTAASPLRGSSQYGRAGDE